jgi:hypothetical protein
MHGLDKLKPRWLLQMKEYATERRPKTLSGVFPPYPRLLDRDAGSTQ